MLAAEKRRQQQAHVDDEKSEAARQHHVKAVKRLLAAQGKVQDTLRQLDIDAAAHHAKKQKAMNELQASLDEIHQDLCARADLYRYVGLDF